MNTFGLAVKNMAKTSEGSFCGNLFYNHEIIGRFHYDEVKKRGSVSFDYYTSLLGNGVDYILSGGYDKYQEELKKDNVCRELYEKIFTDIANEEASNIEVDDFEALLNGKTGFVEKTLFDSLFEGAEYDPCGK